jgi:hypothetical protein
MWNSKQVLLSVAIKGGKEDKVMQNLIYTQKIGR